VHEVNNNIHIHLFYRTAQGGLQEHFYDKEGWHHGQANSNKTLKK
jgi:hypothetical protein